VATTAAIKKKITGEEKETRQGVEEKRKYDRA